ncbi:MAG TPA: flagellar hook-associated protein FlgK [Verrucomicrobiae bacterium]|nr:flagellar hook-associated protein FlgK [Verrucomicrobiae bacterium]
MSNLIAAFAASGNALDVFQQALTTTSNNINNASTPGYAKQTLNLSAMPFDVTGGLVGGVSAQGLTDSRDQYAEESVQQQTSTLGLYTAQSQATATLQSLFDVSGASGVSASLQNLFQAFSAWSVTPNDSTARQSVLNAAGSAAQSISGLDASLVQAGAGLDTQISSTVNQINTLAKQIQQYNISLQQQPQPDPGEQAQLYSSLQSLSQLVNFSTVQQSDGSVTVMLAGGQPLVVGTTVNALNAQVAVNQNPPPAFPTSPPTDQILDSQGNDVTSEITSGQLGGLLDVRNNLLASVIGDGQQQGTLNQLAQGLADTVNNILESGTVSSAPGAANGTALFTYAAGNPTGIAASLAVNPAITAAQLAPVDSSGNSNGNAQQLAALSDATSGLGTIGGQSYIEYYGNIAAAVGQENADASANETTQQQVVSQAASLRDQVSGVSLNQEAVAVMQFQQAYQATAQVLTVLSNLTTTLVNLIQPY